MLRMLEAGAIRDRDDMQNIIDTYKDDYNAMATIKSLISKSSLTVNFIGIIPADSREENKRLLGQLRNNVDLYMNPGMAQMGFNTGHPLLEQVLQL